MKDNISRKDFLKIIGVATAATTLASTGCKPKSEKYNNTYSAGDIPKDKMTYRTNRNSGDVVSILGYGCMRLPRKDNEIAKNAAATILRIGLAATIVGNVTSFTRLKFNAVFRFAHMLELLYGKSIHILFLHYVLSAAKLII